MQLKGRMEFLFIQMARTREMRSGIGPESMRVPETFSKAVFTKFINHNCPCHSSPHIRL